MTSPTSVGSVSVEVLGDAKNLIKSIRKDLDGAFKDLDFGKAIQNAVGKSPIKIPVQAVLDTDGLKEKVRRTRVPAVKVPVAPDTESLPEKIEPRRTPKVPVELDPLIQAFQEEVRRNIRSLSRQTVKLPVTAETEDLRRELATELAKIKAESRIQVPVEPEAKAAYEARLRAQLAEVARRVKQHVEVDVDVDRGGLSQLSGAGSVIGGIGKLLSGLTSSLPGIGRVSSGLSDVTGALQKLSGTTAQAGGSLVGAFSSAAGPIGAVAAATIAAGLALATFGAAGAAAGPVLGAIAAGLVAVAGAAAAIPAALAGAGAAIATLGLGFSGIANAFKKQPKTGGGGGGGGGAAADPEARARRIAAAERGVSAARRGIAAASRGVQAAERGLADAELRVTQAQVRAKVAQEAIGKARREALEDIEDLNRSLKGAQLNEEDAALRVTEALRALNEAKETGILPDISRADLEYRQAIQSLEEAKDTTQDLGDATAEANSKGVEGSDKVKDALQDQADAIQAVKDAQNGVVEAQNSILSANESLAASYDGLKSAQDALTEAQKKAASAGGGGGGASGAFFDVVKLAPNAQKFVDAVKRLKPAFEALRLDVQNRLFKDLDKTITKLAAGYEQPLRRTLGSYADTFNSFFRNLGTAIGTPKFIADLQVGAEGARQGLAAIGKSITSSLVPAFGALSRAAGPFLAQLGKEIAGVVTGFANFILQGEQTGKLETFFAKATEAMHDLFTTTKQVGRLIGNIFQIILNGGGPKSGKSGIDSFNDGLQKVNEYLEDPRNQQRIQEFIADIKSLAKTFGDAAKDAKGVLDVLFPSEGKDAESKKKTLSGFATEIGKLLVAGLFAGVQAGFKIQGQLIIDTFTGPGSFVDAIRHGFGIASPSRVFAKMGKQLVQGLVKGIGDNLADLGRKAKDITKKVLDNVGNVSKTLVTKGRDLIVGLINGIRTQDSPLRTKIAGLKTTVTSALQNPGQFLVNTGRSIVAGLSNGLGQNRGAVSARSLALRSAVTNSFTRSGSLLYGSGAAIITGLIRGINSLGGRLGQTMANVVNSIPSVIQKGLRINSPSKVTMALGRSVPEGLALGIDKQSGVVEAAAARMAAAAIPEIGSAFTDLGSTADLALTSSLSAHAEQRVLLDIAPGLSGDWFRDGLKRNIKLVYNGNVNAALGT